MVAAHPLPGPLDVALEKIANGEGLTKEEAALVRAHMSAADIERTEQMLGVRLEEVLTDSGIAWDDERAFLRGEGPDPWAG